MPKSFIFHENNNVRPSFLPKKIWPLHDFVREKSRRSMKKKEVVEAADHEHEVEIIKAVAQAWHCHSSSTRPTNEFDAYRRNFKNKPSRFKLEAINKSLAAKDSSAARASWDFGKSLWDSYEIVTVSKRLEAGLVFDYNLFSDLDGLHDVSVGKKHKESKRSLRSLFNKMSSRRFIEPPYSQRS